MTARLVAFGLLLLSAATPAVAHRVDEYLQATLIAVEKDRVRADMYLTPGMAVAPIVLADLDADGDGIFSESERRAFAARVLADLSLTLDGERLAPRLIAIAFPTVEEMREGQGDIHLEFAADVSTGFAERTLRLENRHQNRIAVYQVNCLVPRDPEARITAQRRNDSQSIYEVDYVQPGARAGSATRIGAARLTLSQCLGSVAVLALAWLAIRFRQRRRPAGALPNPSPG